MEILNNKIVKRDGNECLLTDAIALIRINYDLYVVTHTSAVDGGWTGHLGETNTHTFRNMNSAVSCYNNLCEDLKEYENN